MYVDSEIDFVKPLTLGTTTKTIKANKRNGIHKTLTEKISWLRMPDLPGFEWLAAENSPELWKVYHENYAICVVYDVGDKGYSRWKYRREIHESSKGFLMIMEPGEVHVTTKILGAGSFDVFFFSESFVEDVLGNDSFTGANIQFKKVNIYDPKLFLEFASLGSLLRNGGTFLELQYTLFRCLQEIVQKYAENIPKVSLNGNRNPLYKVRDYIHEHHRGKVTLEKLEKVAGISRFHLVREFSRTFGLPVHKYLNELRLSKSRKLLLNGTCPTRVDVGFNGASLFYRTFKNEMKITPGQYASGGKIG